MRNKIFLKRHLLISLSPHTCSSCSSVRLKISTRNSCILLGKALLITIYADSHILRQFEGGIAFFLLNVFPQNLHACLLPYAGSKFVYGSLIEPFYEWLLFALLKIFHKKLNSYILHFKWELQCIYPKIWLWGKQS